jgi:hypothetical protein
MDIRKIISEYSTKHIYGFTNKEISTLLEKYDVDQTTFNKELGTNTCMIIDDEVITYHTDIIRAINKVKNNLQ